MKRLALPLLIAFVPLALLAAAVLRKTGMHFTYTLDDPYIHLALARNILLGNYGINVSEPSAPSSSILWPFLLVPFAKLPLAIFELVPLAINVACVALSALVLDRIFAAQAPLLRATLIASILLAFNVYGLAFSGMEHSLQVLMAFHLAYGVLVRGVLRPGTATRALFLWSLLLLPLVRYEGAALSVPILGYLFFSGERRAALCVGVPLAAIVAGFSLYLHSRGLGYIPSSILAKSYYDSGFAVVENLRVNAAKYGWLLLPIGWVCYRRWRDDPGIALLLPAVALLHLTFGKYGWFGRYEVYFVAFVVVIVLRELLAVAPRLGWLALALPLAFNSLLWATVFTPLAASNIANQQRIMAQIARDLGRSVAVNDLGLVALESPHYVLDLTGLGSLEALAARRANGTDTTWIRGLMERKGVEYAFVYPAVFPLVPSNWIAVGELRLNQPLITPASAVVTFFATSEPARDALKTTLAPFAAQSTGRDYSLKVF